MDGRAGRFLEITWSNFLTLQMKKQPQKKVTYSKFCRKLVGGGGILCMPLIFLCIRSQTRVATEFVLQRLVFGAGVQLAS